MIPEVQNERKPLHTLEQQRAAKAWAHVEEIAQKKDRDKLGENYRSAVRKVPAMIKTNGLGQTLAFLLAKEEQDAEALRNPSKAPRKAEGFLYKHLEDWLMDSESQVAWPQNLKDQPLIKAVISVDSVIYRQASQEALAYLGWLKRFAEARLEKGG